jgi:hypothetical protein
MRKSTVEHRINVKLIIAIYLALHLLFALTLYLDLRHQAGRLGVGPGELLSALDGSAAMARGSGTTISRAYNVLVSLVVTSIALAIPLTANMYTPKLIEIFIQDRVNIAVLSFFVLSSAQSIWTAQATWDYGVLRDRGGVYPRTSLWLAFETITLGWSILIPYLYYVFRFLNPTTIIARVADAVIADFDRIPRAGAGRERIVLAQRELEQHILHLGNVILRAIDRADRDVTLDSIRALKRVEEDYEGRKRGLPQEWFLVEADLFAGLSKAAVELISTEKVWVEQKCLHQLGLAYNASLAKMQDAISAISVCTRDMALTAAALPDLGALKLGIRYFNTFLREAVKKKDVHAIYDVFYQYKELAHDLVATHPDLTLEIGRHFKYYSDFARASGLVFIYELGCYEVGSMIEWAYGASSSVGRDLLDILLAFEGTQTSARLVKAKAIAGAFFLERGLVEEETRLVRHLAPVPAALVDQALKDLLATTDPVFWEVTDRQMNFDFVDDARKRAVSTFLGNVKAAGAAAALAVGAR